MELTKIIKYLDKKFNEKIASSWDNVGIQQLTKKVFNDFELDVNNIVICLDVNQEVVNFAINNKANLIISRHPFLFDDLEHDRELKKDLIKQLVKHNIVIYSIHTNYDASPNQDLINLLSTKFPISKTKRIGLENEGYEVKLKSELKVSDYLTFLKEIFKSDVSQTNTNFNFDGKLKSFYIVSGSGGEALIESNLENCYFITGELKWHELVYANDHQVSTLILGHYMENYFVNHLVELLSANFKELSINGIDIHNQLKNL